ncbi:hypothetical protein [Hazenella coriacea]|uniref:Uncharacterized protein n=1 Tax=Hazenella coriacea TaxID=1179467 RepID=A0A4V2UV75_9BACL|nr:hypothetical protein [Hazenella coriacea]TCS94657.1 hypothetical protein EDD58_10369 [Hazenella coriacea]
MQLTDALFNWIQIKIVWQARPSDRSARDTVHFFEEMLREDHQIEQLELEKKKEDQQYVVTYQKQGETESHTFPIETAEKLLKDILAEPKYNQSFE